MKKRLKERNKVLRNASPVSKVGLSVLTQVESEAGPRGREAPFGDSQQESALKQPACPTLKANHAREKEGYLSHEAQCKLRLRC